MFFFFCFSSLLLIAFAHFDILFIILMGFLCWFWSPLSLVLLLYLLKLNSMHLYIFNLHNINEIYYFNYTIFYEFIQNENPCFQQMYECFSFFFFFFLLLSASVFHSFWMNMRNSYSKTREREQKKKKKKKTMRNMRVNYIKNETNEKFFILSMWEHMNCFFPFQTVIKWKEISY